ncbi:MAG: KEOPS complex subunit Cgi121 [Candidatus Heimdallarchaeaceae archaeon]
MRKEYKDIEFSFDFFIFNIHSSFTPSNILKELKGRNNNSKTIIQALDPKYIVSERHLQVGVYHTLKAFQKKRNIAREMGTELILRLAGKRQISKALKIFGLSNNTEKILILAVTTSKEECTEILNKFLEQIKFPEMKITKELPVTSLDDLASFYQSPPELATIEKFALERIASVELEI